MAERIEPNVDIDHIGVKPDGTADESGPFTVFSATRYKKNRLVTNEGRMVKDGSRANRGQIVKDTQGVAITTEKSRTSHVVGVKEQPVAVHPEPDMAGKTGVTISFYDALTALSEPSGGLRYTRTAGPVETENKVTLDNAVSSAMKSTPGRKLFRLDEVSQISYEEALRLAGTYVDITTNRIIPLEMPLANLGGPLFGNASLGWNSIFFYVFKINQKYDNINGDRWTSSRSNYWMLRTTKSTIKKKQKIKVVAKNDNGKPGVIEKEVEYNEVKDVIISEETEFPRNTFEVSWLGDGLPAELDNRLQIINSQGQLVTNPDYMHRTSSGRMPVWRNVENPNIILAQREATRLEMAAQLNERSNEAQFNDYWNKRITWAQDYVDEEDRWNKQLDHYTLYFGNPARASRCVWRELIGGVYSMYIDANRSAYCSFDLTHPNRYVVGKFNGVEFVKPSKVSGKWKNEYSNEVDLRVLAGSSSNHEFSIFLRPRVLRFAGTTIYSVVYMVLMWPYGIPIFYVDPVWPEAMNAKFVLPWTNSGGHSYMIGGSQAVDYYKNTKMPVPFNAAMFTMTHFGGIPLTWYVVGNYWNLYAEPHPKKDSDGTDGVPIAIIRRFDKTGNSDLYCVYYFDDGQDNPLNKQELLFTWAV